MIDFTDVHVQRVDRLTFQFEVTGDTLEDLGKRAQEQAHTLYGNWSFRITSMDVAPTTAGPSGKHSEYRASVWTEVV